MLPSVHADTLQGMCGNQEYKALTTSVFGGAQSFYGVMVVYLRYSSVF